MARKYKIAPINFGTEMRRILSQYKLQIEQILDHELESYGEQLVDRVSEYSKAGHFLGMPEERTGAYAKGWTLSTRFRRGKFRYVVHNATEYRLTHLLEHGHLSFLKTGAIDNWTPPYPHIRPAFDETAPAFIERVKQRLGGI